MIKSMYGENQRLSEGIPSTTILINIAAFIPVYTADSFFPGDGFYLGLKIASSAFIFLSQKYYTSFKWWIL